MTLRGTVRGDRRLRVAALVGGVFVAVAFGLVHWAGFFVGGAFAGVFQRSLPRGVGAGALAGVGAWLAFAVGLWTHGALGPALAATPLVAVSLGAPVALASLGGLLRGVV